MGGDAIGALAIGHAGLRRLPQEQVGPRPAGVRGAETRTIGGEPRQAQATRP